MADRLVIEERRAGKPDREEALLASHAESLGVPILRTTWKPFVRKRVQPGPGDIVAGSVSFVRAALQSLGKQLPPPDPYPESLRGFLHRKVWQGGTVADVLASEQRVFIKPAKRWKLFTGFVIDQPNPPQLHAVSRREPVWCSEVVTWLSEWRAYVIDRHVQFVGLSDHGGDRDHRPDRNAIEIAAIVYTNAPAAYAMDFGVLSTGQTALIEVNDGFSVGAYGDIPASIYYDFIATRWKQLTRDTNDFL